MWIWITKDSIVWRKIVNFLSIFRVFVIFQFKIFQCINPFWLAPAHASEIPNTRIRVQLQLYFEKANLLPLITLCTGSWTKVTNRIMQNIEWMMNNAYFLLRKLFEQWTAIATTGCSSYWAVKTMQIIIWILMNTKVRSLDLNPIGM